MSNQINVTACDNQLILLAYQSGACFEIANIQSGNNNSVDVTLDIVKGSSFSGTVNLNGVNKALSTTNQVTLPAGTYTLVYAGVNWGGPYNFKMEVNKELFELSNGAAMQGIVWAKGDNKIQLTVA